SEPCATYQCRNDPCNQSWNTLRDIIDFNPSIARNILLWNGHPSSDDVGNRRIPWITPTRVEGIVPESFLSGEDLTLDHREAPGSYWLGSALPSARGSCGGGGFLRAVNALCNDWAVYVRPDPDYRFALSPDHRDTACYERARRGQSCPAGMGL